MRKTLKVEVEVTIEDPNPSYFAQDLADDIRDRVFSAVADNIPGDVVLMTVTGVGE